MAIIAEIIAAAASVVSAGTSLAGTSLSNLMDENYMINCGIQVENWTRFLFSEPVVKLSHGVLSIPPGDIIPSKREAMVARKTADTATGSSGTVSWLIEENKRRIVIMWGVPFDYILYSNWLGVGITTRGKIDHAPGDEWFNQMYYGDSSKSLGFSSSRYDMEANSTIYEDDLFEISGTMSTGHQAVVKINVRPKNSADLAAPIKKFLETAHKTS